MAGVVFLILPLSVLVLMALAALAFFDVALGELAVASGRRSSGVAENRGVPSLSNRDRSPAWELASTLGQLSEGASEVARHGACRFERFVPLVTEPEARSIAMELSQRGDGVLAHVIAKSRRHEQSCPMRTDDGLCGCGTARPLACIGRCAQGDDSTEWVAGLGESLSQAFRHHLELHHANAESRRLDDALVSHLDRARESAV